MNPCEPFAPLREAPYCSNPADTAKPILRELTTQLSASLRKPGRRTLSLIDKALSYLTPFESPKASITSLEEKRDLLELLNVHRLYLSPYIDTDKIERNLRHLR